MKDRRFVSRLLVTILLGAAISSCDHSLAPTTADPGADPFAATAERTTSETVADVEGGSPSIPEGIENLPMEPLLRRVLVEFPGPSDVGVCHTQVASRGRPVPFRVHRLVVEVPEGAWAEAEGRTTFLQYRRLGENGFVLRVARCRIPASRLAVEHLFDRFSVHGSARWSGSGVSLSGPAVAGVESGWEVVLGMERASGILNVRGGLVALTAGDDDCVENNNEDNPCELEEIVVTVCENPNHTFDASTDECACENGSTEPDCSYDGNETTGEPDSSSDPDCSFEPCGGGSNPGDPDECDPSVEICDPCGDERDVMIGEYELLGVNLSPGCEDFASSGGTGHFDWPELNGRGPGSTPPYGNLHWESGQWGIVRVDLKTGLETTRLHYGKPIVLTGGYRCPHGNDGVGGSSTSWHMHGRAADMRSEAQYWTMAECTELRDIIAHQTNHTELLQCDTYGQPGHLHAAW